MDHALDQAFLNAKKVKLNKRHMLRKHIKEMIKQQLEILLKKKGLYL